MRLVCLFAVVALVTGCGGRAPAGGPPPSEPYAPPTPLYGDPVGGLRDSMRVVVRDQAALARHWQDATSSQPSPPSVPTVNFEREMVLVVAAGKMKSQDEIRVDSLVVRKEMDTSGREQETLIVIVRITEACRPLQIDGYPVAIAKVRRFNGPVKFDDRRVKATC
jgi:hypothetical protein